MCLNFKDEILIYLILYESNQLLKEIFVHDCLHVQYLNQFLIFNDASTFNVYNCYNMQHLRSINIPQCRVINKVNGFLLAYTGEREILMFNSNLDVFKIYKLEESSKDKKITQLYFDSENLYFVCFINGNIIELISNEG